MKRILRKLISNVIGSVVQSSFFINRGFSQPIFNATDTETLLKDGYQGNADVFAIINYISTLASNIQWTVSEVKDEKALAAFKNMEEYDFKAMELQAKSMHQLDTHPILDVLMCPNTLQTQSEFIYNWCGFKLATGNAYIHGVKPAVGNNKTVIKELYNIPSQHVEIIPGDFRHPIRGYQIDINGQRVVLEPETVSHSKYFNPDFRNGQSLYGMAPLESAFRNLGTSNEADIARKSSFENQGAVGMISSATDDVERMSPAELKDLSDTYQDKLSGAANLNKVLFTTGMAKWDNMGLSPVDLAIIESKVFDLRVFCNIFMVNSGRFNDPENKRFNNAKEGRKADMTDAVMPLLNSLRDELMIWLVPAYEELEGRKLFLSPDWKSVAVLQADMELLVKWLKEAWWITPNQKLKIQGMDESTNERMDEVFIPSNLLQL